MAEINKIKVGETTYDVNPSWATGDGVTAPIKIGTNGALTIGTAGLISMSTAVSIGNSAYVEGNLECTQGVFTYLKAANNGVEFGPNAIRIGSKGDAKVDIIGALYINGVGFDPTAIPPSASIEGVAIDGDNLIIGTGDNIKNIYIGTNLKPNVILDQQAVKLNGPDIIEIGSIIGYQRMKEDGTLIIGSGACGKKQNIQVGLDDTNISVMALDSGYNKLDKVSIKASTIDLPTATKLYFNGIPISKSGNALIFDDQNTELSLDSGWRLTRDKLRVDVVEAYDVAVTRSFSAKTSQGAQLRVEEKTIDVSATNTINLKMDTGVGLTIDRNAVDAYASTCRIGAEDTGFRQVVYMRAHPSSAIDVAHSIEVTPTEILIDDFKFECDKENSKLTISYNGKKAEIQLN